MEDIKQTVDQVMDDIATKRDEAMGKTDAPTQNGEKKKMDEITIKFGKGCVGEPFTGRDGKEYKQILIPNKDENDHSPWATFVARSNAVHEDQFGKGMWMKLPADGQTKVSRSIITGQDENGKNVYETTSRTVTNRDLKGMLESYKNRERTSIKDALAKPPVHGSNPQPLRAGDVQR